MQSMYLDVSQKLYFFKLEIFRIFLMWLSFTQEKKFYATRVHIVVCVSSVIFDTDRMHAVELHGYKKTIFTSSMLVFNNNALITLCM